MVAEAIGLTVLVVACVAEALHGRRCRRLGRLTFGPTGRPRAWVGVAPALTIASMTLLAWGLATLWLLDPKLHVGDAVDEKLKKDMLLVLDVSPSMFLADAGPNHSETRRKRVSDVVTSLFNRLPMREYRVSLIAFYTEAKPLLKQSSDLEILRHILEELPTYQGFKGGKTDLFAGLQFAAQFARHGKPNSTTMVVLTDGMTVPPSGMPRMPASIGSILVVGVGDPHAGKFIDGHQSRQDTTHLRQVAHRLGGTYHNANVKHIPTSTINSIRLVEGSSSWNHWTRREWALAATMMGALGLSTLPALLHWFGTAWQPGVPMARIGNKYAGAGGAKVF